MKWAVPVCCLLFSLVTSVSRGEDSVVPTLEDLTWLLGEWEGDYVMPEGSPEIAPAGTKIHSTNSWTWTLGRKFIALRIRDEANGKVVSTGEELMGADQRTGGLGHWFFGSVGFHGDGVWSKQADAWALKWESFDPNGKKYEGTSYHIRLDENAYTWQMRDLSEDGKSIPDWPKVTYRRTSGQPAGELWKAFVEAASGTWSGQAQVLETSSDAGLVRGDKLEGEFLLEAEMDGSALVGEMSFKAVDKPVAGKSCLLGGWDPAQQKIRLIGFWNTGMTEEILLSKQQGTAFQGTYTAKGVGMATRRARVHLDYPDADSFVATFLDGPHKGEQLSSWKRKK